MRQLGNRTCVECHRIAGRRRRAADPLAKREETYAWRRKNPDAHRAIERRSKRKYMRERRARDLDFRLKHILRCRLSKAVRSLKLASAVRDLGCTVGELRTHLELQFQPGMSWENYGICGWEIDHIRPLARFDLTDEAQARAACHYTNLQPLWAEDNLKKRAS